MTKRDRHNGSALLYGFRKWGTVPRALGPSNEWVVGFDAALDVVEDLLRPLREVRELHKPCTCRDGTDALIQGVHCGECDSLSYPCATIELLALARAVDKHAEVVRQET